MKKHCTNLFIIFLYFMISSNAQGNFLNSQLFELEKDFSKNHNTKEDTLKSDKTNPKGFFFISPFYQFTNFTKLKLDSHTNYHKLIEGNTTYHFPQEDIDEYNNHYETEYTNNMAGIKFGYQMPIGLGGSIYIGLDHYNFKSWISKEYHQSHSSDFPAITIGFALDYKTNVYEKLLLKSIFSYNYCRTNDTKIKNSSGEDILSAHLETQYWELNLVLGYPMGSFLPYAGAGYTKMWVNAKQKEQIDYLDENGTKLTNETEFDSRFSNDAFYGFAGIEYLLSKNLSIYVRGSFPNPLRANCGMKIIL